MILYLLVEIINGHHNSQLEEEPSCNKTVSDITKPKVHPETSLIAKK